MAKAATKTPVPSAKMPVIVKGSAKAAIGQEGISRTNQLLMVAPALLRVIPGFNPRIHELPSYAADMEILKASIRAEGFYVDKPIAGYVGKDGDADVIYVIDGHRRMEAVTALIEEGVEIGPVPVILKPAETDIVKLTVATVKENIGRKLTFFENSIVVRRLFTHGKSKGDVASLLDFTEQAVEDFAVLIEAPKKIRDYVKLDRIAGTEAVRIIKENRKAPEKALEKIEAMIAKAEARKGPGAKATRKDDETAKPIKAKTGGKSREETIEEEGDEDEAPPPVTKSVTKVKVTAPKGYAVTPVGWRVDAGETFPVADIRHFKNLIGDKDWYKLDEDRANLAVALESVEFLAYVIRAKKQPDEAAEGEGAAEGGEGEAEAGEAEVDPEDAEGADGEEAGEAEAEGTTDGDASDL